MNTPAGSRPPLVVGSRWMLLITVLCLVWIYGYRIAANPAKWEEPRRSLVAMEMIHTGDYVVPRLFGKPYLNKPPLQNWMIGLFAGFRFERVEPATGRLVSLAALAGVAWLLWRLGLDGRRPRPDIAPALIFVTLGLTVQFGRAGEIDMLFCFWITGALACVELGRRRGSAFLRWVPSQALIAAGVLTKGLAPLFFYPPVLYSGRRTGTVGRGQALALAAGLCLLLLLVAIWLVPYLGMAPQTPLGRSWSRELSRRTIDPGFAGWLRHIVGYPFLLLGVTLPWSLALFGASREGLRRTLGAVQRDPWLSLCTAVTLWGVLLFAVVPGTKGRYLLPILPCASVLVAALLRHGAADRLRRLPRRPAFWALLLALVVGAYLVGRLVYLERYRDLAVVPLFAGLALWALFAAASRACRDRPTGLPLLLLGLVYGIGYAGVAELNVAEHTSEFVDTAHALERGIDAGAPVLIHGEVDRRLAFELSRLLGRPLSLVVDPEQRYDFVAPLDVPPRRAAELVVAAGDYALYRIEPPQAWSLLGQPLYPPPLPLDVAAERRLRLAEAQRVHRRDPHDAEGLIWLGRRTAYLGRYREAIEVFSEGIRRHPQDPRFYRHRGHRYITLRRFERAIADLERADALADARPDEIEPDGLPNPRNLPRTTLRFNVRYHLGLARYLEGDLPGAARELRRSLAVSHNPDTLCATTFWLYTTLRRLGRDGEAAQLLQPIRPELELLENHDYHELLLLYRGARRPTALREQALDGAGGVARATLGHGLANWHQYEGRPEQAEELLRRVVEGESWAAFGHIAAEATLARRGRRAPW